MFNVKKLFVVAAVAVLTVTAFGQGQGRGGFGMFGRGGVQQGAMLLNRPDVQNDLKLTDDQKTKLQEVRTGMRDKMRSAFQDAGGDQAKMQEAMKAVMEDINKQTNAILTADQQKRLKEIGIQLAGNSAATLEDVQSQLMLTDDQKSKIKELQKGADEANAAIGQKMRNQEIDFQAAREAFTKNSTALNDAIGKILTDAQKTKLKELGGATFTPDPPRG
jgi:hypothetical protein